MTSKRWRSAAQWWCAQASALAATVMALVGVAAAEDAIAGARAQRASQPPRSLRLTDAPRAVSPRRLLVQQSALAAAGNRAVVLMAGSSLLARVVDGTHLGRLQRLDGSAYPVRVGVGPDGTAVAAWIAGRALRVAVAPPGRSFGRVETLAAGGPYVFLGGVAVTATGRAVVAWRGAPPTAVVHAAVRPPGGDFGPPQSLGESKYMPGVAAAPSGTALVTWLKPSGTPAQPDPPGVDPNRRVLVSMLAAGAGRFAAPVELTTPPTVVSGIPNAIGGPGGAVVLWSEMLDTRIARLTTSGRFSQNLVLRTWPQSGYSDGLALVLPTGGRMTAIWRTYRTRTAEDPTITAAQVNSSFLRPDGSFAPTDRLSADGWLAGVPAAVARGDRTVAAWSEHKSDTGARLRIAVLSGQGRWTAPRTVSSGTAIGTVHAGATAGRTILAWIQRGRTRPGRMYLAALGL